MLYSRLIAEIRGTIRELRKDTDFYTDSIAPLVDIIREDVPDIDMRQGALFALAMTQFMFSADCQQACIHDIARDIAALGDRILLDCEMEEHLNL